MIWFKAMEFMKTIISYMISIKDHRQNSRPVT